MADELKRILNAELFHFMVEARIPFSKREPIDFTQASRDFMSLAFKDKIQQRVWPVLLTLSQVGLNNMPDMMEFLPSQSDPDFALQCLGLQLVIDQAPRALCSMSSTDGRYVNSYFDIVSHRLAESWLALPTQRRPDSWETNQDRMSFDFWILLRLWLGAPLVHNGTPHGQKIALAFSDETRRVVEEISSQVDPNRADRGKILSDIFAFPRMIEEGPPVDEGVTAASWTYWMMKLMDVHKPIVDRFGRYPYQNNIRGLESTKEEKDWIEKVDHFGEAPSDIAKKVKEDIERGRWTPLGA
ncbi:hypothetical protein R3P38DRAFT_2858276 [Favolaschia claudopus]|uniref:Uncharacterized protein n=1 Tax=Favolaschia claudopus TaxID=2862362 RepID=A0AAW0DL57_9AGAR